MSQTGYTPIQIYSTSTAAAVPTAGSLTNSTLGSELAINITDGKLFYKDNANAVQVIGWKVVPATAGGTGQTSYAIGDILYADTTTSLAKLADVATGNALISGGVGVAPAWGKIGLTTHVSGTLPVTNGGTGTATAFTAGSVVFAGASGVYSQNNANFFWDNANTRLGVGTTTPAAFLHASQSYATPTGGISADTVGIFSKNNTANGNANLSILSRSSGRQRIYFGSQLIENGQYIEANNPGDANGYLAFGTGTGSVAAAERTRIFASGGISIGDTTDPGAANLRLGTGNLGIGVSPYGWTSFRSLDILTYGSFASTTANALFAANAFFNGNWIYKQTAAATYYTQNTGIHAWYTAASGTAGNTITWTEAMRISNDNFVGVGTAAPAARLHLGGAITASSWTTNGIGLRYAAATYTDSSTAASGTVASSGIHALARPTIAATNATVTYTNAATLYIANSPANGSNVTVTNPWSIWVDDGNVRFDGNEVAGGLLATSAAAPTIASATTIAPTTRIAFVSGTTAIATITAPAPISSGGGQITLIPTGLWTTNTTGNIALASTAVVNRALIMTYDATTAKWYPSY